MSAQRGVQEESVAALDAVGPPCQAPCSQRKHSAILAQPAGSCSQHGTQALPAPSHMAAPALTGGLQPVLACKECGGRCGVGVQHRQQPGGGEAVGGGGGEHDCIHTGLDATSVHLSKGALAAGPRQRLQWGERCSGAAAILRTWQVEGGVGCCLPA